MADEEQNSRIDMVGRALQDISERLSAVAKQMLGDTQEVFSQEKKESTQTQKDLDASLRLLDGEMKRNTESITALVKALGVERTKGGKISTKSGIGALNQALKNATDKMQEVANSLSERGGGKGGSEAAVEHGRASGRGGEE